MSSFHLYISFHLTLWVACVPLESPLAYNMYLFNLRFANHIVIKIQKIHFKNKDTFTVIILYPQTLSIGVLWVGSKSCVRVPWFAQWEPCGITLTSAQQILLSTTIYHKTGITFLNPHCVILKTADVMQD